MTQLLGIDISVYQPAPDPVKLNSSGLAFCWVKATEGITIQSSSFNQQYENVGKSALLRGPYHFFIPGDDGVAQAKNFASKAKAAYTAGDLPPMIDVETALSGTSPAVAIQNLKNCIAQVIADFGVQPLIYTYVPYWKDTLGNPTGFSASPLWLASYTTSQPVLVGDWTALTIWQYTAPLDGKPGTGYAANIFPSGTLYIDGDYFYGNLSDLWNLAGMGPIGQSSNYNPKVVALQSQLTTLGYNTNGIDGLFGPGTASALAAWQNANKLPANGTITADQWMLLFHLKTA